YTAFQNAGTSILAAANPVSSRCNPKQPITRNIDLPLRLISRFFHLQYLVLDRVGEVAEKRVAQHLVSIYLENAPVTCPAQDIFVSKVLRRSSPVVIILS
ncbi:MAG TPA: hypothetical protein VGO47_09525, partial [Chlamydiales bacterium]|nr:hypothetical protein [Chlamydiales bacterium]